VFSAFYCSTAISSVSALSMYTFSAIFSKFGVVVLVGGLGCTSYILLLSPVTHDVHLHVGLLRCERLFLNLFREVVSIGIPVYWFFLAIFSVSSLSMNTFTAILLDLMVNVELHGVLLRHIGLVLDDDDGAGVGCPRRQRSVSARQAPRTCPWQPTRFSSSQS
jgi:hypothetical protein